jgi:4-hydroxy-tetrahydrodipicolinate reductase
VTEVDDMKLVGCHAPGHEGETISGVEVSARPWDRGAVDVVVEVTRPDVVMATLETWSGIGAHVVVGTSGFDSDRLSVLEQLWATSDTGCLVVPNFSIGAVLMMRFAEEAARHFEAAEVIELHHDQKADAPSGTGVATAQRIGAAAPHQRRATSSFESVPGSRGGEVAGIPVHSVRLPGLLAHQEVLFGNAGEVLTIRHDSTDRASFMPGVLLAIRNVSEHAGVTVGLDHLL